MAVEINIPKPIIDLPETLTNGNETDGNDIVLTPLDRVVVGANRAGLSKGTFDTSRGGDKGVSLICANDLELNWQSGFLRNMVPDGDGTPLVLNLDSEIVYTELVPTTPTYGTSLVTKDYADTKEPELGFTIYLCAWNCWFIKYFSVTTCCVPICVYVYLCAVFNSI